MSLLEIKQALKHKLANTYEPIELNSIIAMLIEHVTAWDTLKQAMRKNDEIEEDQDQDQERNIINYNIYSFDVIYE